MVRMNVDTDEGKVRVEGVLLAQTSSRRYRHNHPGAHVPSGQRCSACRWTRVTILKRDETYLVVTEGFSLVAGELTRGRVVSTTSPLWVIQCLYVRKRDRLSIAARNALIVAADHDKELARECEARGIG
jgi:hypothetical protein